MINLPLSTLEIWLHIATIDVEREGRGTSLQNLPLVNFNRLFPAQQEVAVS